MNKETLQENESVGSRMAAALDEYLESMELGAPISRGQFLSKYPEIAEELGRCLESLDFIRHASTSYASADQESHTRTDASGPGCHTLGDYRLIHEIGRGGMGVVYEAEQISLGRRVAVKVLPFAAMLDQRQLERFRNEVRAAAMLKHTHIVSVFQVGNERGVHFYAMELVEGQSLDRVIRNLRTQSESSSTGRGIHHSESREALQPAPSTPPDASTQAIANLSTRRGNDPREFHRSVARLAIEAAGALQYAHHEGVVHRDVKPSNLIIDRDGKLWITDFGLARIQNADNQLTVTGDVLGTLRYMSPEQAAGRQGVVDHRTDVYSLGASLYELLTGQPALPGEGRQEILKQLDELQPIPPRRLDSTISKDLETIVMTALAKEPSDRYPTAGDLAGDLRRFLDHKPITATRPSQIQKLCKWCQRHAAITTISAAFFLVLIAGLVLTTTQWRRAVTQEANLREQVYVHDVNLAYRSWYNGDATAPRRLLSRHESSDHRGFEWHYLWNRLAEPKGKSRITIDIDILDIALSPDGEKLAITGHLPNNVTAGVISVRNLKTGKVLFRKSEKGRVYRAAFSPNGTLLATGAFNNFSVWNVESGEKIGTFEAHDGFVDCLAFSPKDGTLASGGSSDENVRIWDLKQGNVIRALDGRARSLVFSSDGDYLVAGGRDHIVRVWDSTNWVEVASFRCQNRVETVAISSDKSMIVAGGRDSRIKFWDLASGKDTNPVETGSHQAHALEFLPNGEFLLTGGQDGSLRIWDIKTGVLHSTLRGHTEPIWALCLSPDGRTAFTAGQETVRTWHIDTTTRPHADVDPLHEDWYTKIAFSNDGSTLFAGGGHWDFLTSPGFVAKYHVDSEQSEAFASPSANATNIALSPSNKLLAAGLSVGEVVLYNVATSTIVDTIPTKHPWPLGIAFGNTSKSCILAVSSLGFGVESFEIAIWQLDDDGKKEVQRWPAHHDWIEALAFSPDDSVLASASHDGTAKLWDIDNVDQPRRVLRGHSSLVSAIAFSPDGKLVATGSWDTTVAIWNAATGIRKNTEMRHRHVVMSLAFSRDGRTLASGSVDTTIKLWHVPTGTELATLQGPRRPVMSVAFTPDGKTLASGYGDRRVVFWKTDE